ncbi:restriction endonuclease subunit S [Paraburkholderia sp. DGU8]|uniref:restriction endonuclease subunit S n=1 Tax=Paraburkholderia sp. DGU8 TaxID=3161997 RepID=UPI0034665AC9
MNEQDSMPKDWRATRLRFVASIRNSNVDKKSYDDQVPVLLCNYTDVYYNERITSKEGLMKATASQAEIEKFELLAGDVIITKDSETADDIGIPAWVPESLPGVVCGYHLTQLRANACILPEYLFRSLQAQTTRKYLEIETPGVTRFGLDQDTIGSIPINVPPREVQQNIVAHLNRATARIDTLVAKKTRFIELLREKRQALITHAVTKGLNPGVPMKDSGVEWLGEVPAHWNVVPSQWLFSESIARAYENDEMLSATQKYGVIPKAEFERMEGRRVTHAEMHLDKRKHADIDNFVISMRSFQGGIERVKAPGCVRSSYVVLVAGPHVDPAYFSYLFKSSGYIFGLQATSTFIRDGQDLNFNNFRQVKLPAFQIEEQKAIASYLARATSRIDTLVAKIERSIDLLREHRIALITDAVTGKIDMRIAA